MRWKPDLLPRGEADPKVVANEGMDAGRLLRTADPR